MCGCIRCENANRTESAVRTQLSSHRLLCAAFHSCHHEDRIAQYTCVCRSSTLRPGRLINQHPTSHMKQRALGDIDLTTLENFLGLYISMGLLRKKKRVGLLVTMESVTVYSVLCTCHVVPQICTDATSVSCWHHPQACGQPNFDP